MQANAAKRDCNNPRKKEDIGVFVKKLLFFLSFVPLRCWI
jgi:hypothetical protein